MPNPKALSLDDALAAVVKPAAGNASMDEALAKAQQPQAATFSRAPDPEGAFALADLAQNSPKAAAAGAIGGMATVAAAPAVAAAAGRAALAAPALLHPDVIGMLSPRLANAMRVAQNVVEASRRALPAAVDTASKMNIKAEDVLRIKTLMEQGIPQGEAVRTVMNLRLLGKL